MGFRIVTAYHGGTETTYDTGFEVMEYILNLQQVWAADRSSYRVEVYTDSDVLIFGQLVGDINEMSPNFALDFSVFD
jgi:hypothetical protein